MDRTSVNNIVTDILDRDDHDEDADPVEISVDALANVDVAKGTRSACEPRRMIIAPEPGVGERTKIRRKAATTMMTRAAKFPSIRDVDVAEGTRSAARMRRTIIGRDNLGNRRNFVESTMTMMTTSSQTKANPVPGTRGSSYG